MPYRFTQKAVNAEMSWDQYSIFAGGDVLPLYQKTVLRLLASGNGMKLSSTKGFTPSSSILSKTSATYRKLSWGPSWPMARQTPISSSNKP